MTGTLTREQWNARISQIAPELWVGEVACRSVPWLATGTSIDAVVSILTPDQAALYDEQCPVDPRLKHTTFNYGDGDEIVVESMHEILAAFGNCTLLHCVSGANRSTAVALCWLLTKGLEPFAAANHYWAARGDSTAKVYSTMPRMARKMCASVDRFYKALKENQDA